MEINSLNDVFRFGKFNGCTFGEIMKTNPDYIIWAAKNVEGKWCCFTENAIHELNIMFPDFDYDDSFLQAVERQRLEYEEANCPPESQDHDYDNYDDNYDNYDDYNDDFEPSYYEEQTYGRYAGSYAQDEMGYSDEEIDIIFEGDPSAYWNID